MCELKIKQGNWVIYRWWIEVVWAHTKVASFSGTVCVHLMILANMEKKAFGTKQICLWVRTILYCLVSSTTWDYRQLIKGVSLP